MKYLERSDIARWLAERGEALRYHCVEFTVEESVGETDMPSAFADFFRPEFCGRITGWISGEFDFEVLRNADLQTVLHRRTEVSGLDELSNVYQEFEAALLNIEETKL